MLVLAEGGKLKLIFQHDHAALSGRIALAWRCEFIAHAERRGEVLRAVAEHDSGWEEADSRGFFDEASGRPASFLDMPGEAYPPLWLGSIEEAARIGPLAGYLVARHFATLAGFPSSAAADDGREEARDKAMDDFRSAVGETLVRLEAAVPPPAAHGPYPLAERALDNDFRFLQLNDLLSLVVCGGHSRPTLVESLRRSSIAGEPFKVEIPKPHTVRLAPWVFEADELIDAVPVHSIADRPYPGSPALAEAIARAEPSRRTVAILPL